MELFKGKKLSLIRLFGAFLILISLLSSLFLDSFILINWFLFLILLSFNLPWLILSISLKFEISFLRNNLLRISIILAIFSTVMAIYGILISHSITFLFLIIMISNFLLLVCWHYSPSIYKREKLLSIIGGISYVLVYSFLKISTLISLFGLLTG
ncbi:MAG: hypothetical protein ACFFEO_16685, partial [Candidatus Thorarchaeota archaeon]